MPVATAFSPGCHFSELEIRRNYSGGGTQVHDTPDSHQTTGSQEENREDAMQSGAMCDHMIEIRNGHCANGGGAPTKRNQIM